MGERAKAQPSTIGVAFSLCISFLFPPPPPPHCLLLQDDSHGAALPCLALRVLWRLCTPPPAPLAVPAPFFPAPPAAPVASFAEPAARAPERLLAAHLAAAAPQPPAVPASLGAQLLPGARDISVMGGAGTDAGAGAGEGLSVWAIEPPIWWSRVTNGEEFLASLLPFIFQRSDGARSRGEGWDRHCCWTSWRTFEGFGTAFRYEVFTHRNACTWHLARAGGIAGFGRCCHHATAPSMTLSSHCWRARPTSRRSTSMRLSHSPFSVTSPRHGPPPPPLPHSHCTALVTTCKFRCTRAPSFSFFL